MSFLLKPFCFYGVNFVWSAFGSLLNVAGKQDFGTTKLIDFFLLMIGLTTLRTLSENFDNILENYYVSFIESNKRGFSAKR